MENNQRDFKKVTEDQLHLIALRAARHEASSRAAGLIAHDFNNYLQSLLLNTQFMGDEIDSSHPAYTDLQDNLKVVMDASGFIRDVLSKTKKFSVQNCASRIDGFAESLGHLIRSRDQFWDVVEFENDVSEKISKFETDQTLLLECIAGLLENSIAASDKKGSVQMLLWNREFPEKEQKILGVNQSAFLVLTISDSGGGFPEEVLENIGEVFVTTKNYHEGFGMSIPGLYETVRRAHGFIDIRSIEGSGTDISIYMPCW